MPRPDCVDSPQQKPATTERSQRPYPIEKMEQHRVPPVFLEEYYFSHVVPFFTPIFRNLPWILLAVFAAPILTLVVLFAVMVNIFLWMVAKNMVIHCQKGWAGEWDLR